MKHRNSASSTAQLLGTLSFRAARAVDEAVCSVADSDVLRAVDSAVGQVFYSAVFEPVYKRAWCAVAATWLTKRGIHFKHKAAVLGATVAATPRKQGQAITALTSKLTLRDRWMRLTKMTIIPVAVAALAGFVGGYNSRAPNHPVEVAVARSPEIRRAIPVEPEIRKAVPVQTRKPQVNRRSDSMAFISPGSAIARDFATRRANANPLVGKTSRSVVRRKASK